MTAQIEYTRLDLMGIGKPESERTADERRLATIILAHPLHRAFTGRRDSRALYRMQDNFDDLRARFVVEENEGTLRIYAQRIIDIDRTLSRRAVLQAFPEDD